MAKSKTTVLAIATLVTGRLEGKKVVREEHPPGSKVSLDAKEAANLIARGLAASADAAPPPSPPEPDGPVKPVDADELQAAIIAAIGELDPENDEHATASGKPHTAALAEILGYKVTAAERDSAHEAVMAAARGNGNASSS
jgi:hypothetical protein